MLQSLIKLRRSNWGHSPPGSVAGAGQGAGQDSLPGAGTFSLDPTFYAPDGEVRKMKISSPVSREISVEISLDSSL